MIKRLLLVTIGLAALILNPFFGCGEDVPDYHFSADEMRAAVEGTWKLSVRATASQPAIEVVFSISQATARPPRQHSSRAGLVPEAAACSKRSLVRAAAACGDSTDMPLDLILADGTKAEGKFSVYGTEFAWGFLDLQLAAISTYARITTLGVVTEVGGRDLKATLVRIATAQR